MGKANEGPCSRWKHIVSSVSIIGPNGQLGTDLVKVFSVAGWKVVPITHADISVENLESVRESLKTAKSEWVINTAGFHKVDECEKDSAKAWRVNSFGPLNVARAAKAIGSRSVFISSDYVFSGNQDLRSSYSETDEVSPVNAYGHSKAAGEIATLAVDQTNLVVRIASVFGSAGSSGKSGNFVETILSKAKAGDPLKVVNDIYMSPTYTVDASQVILRALAENQSGTIHASNSGAVSWFDFASTILQLTGISTDLSPSETNWDQTPKRPPNSSLSVLKAIELIPSHSDWRDALYRYLLEKGHI